MRNNDWNPGEKEYEQKAYTSLGPIFLRTNHFLNNLLFSELKYKSGLEIV